MKKVININFQGRVIPIEETAYVLLQKYVESLRLFFANEEGRDEIINDIEGRIAELFGETLKKGSTCITDGDVNKIIDSMGRPEDFDDDEAKVHSQLGSEKSTRQQSYTYSGESGAKRLYRDENHKVIAGVCSGIANYFAIDPVITRIVAIVFFGAVLIPYLIFWVAVPSSASTVIGAKRKRLFRDPDNKIIAGVCSGLASYFAINIWIPRILFLIPFMSFVFRSNHFGWWSFPQILSWSFSPGSFVVYIILWIILPEAKSAADKLEMKGEKVDLNNIKTTIQGDLEGFKDRAEKFGGEMKDKAQEFSESFNKRGQQFANEAAPVIKRSSRGLGDVIVLLVKIFAYFILGCVLFSVVASLFTLGVITTGLLPAKDFILRDGMQSVYAWGALLFFIWVPVVGIITWIIRRLAKKRGNSQLIRYTFISLWLIGLVCVISLIVSLVNDFRYKNNPAEQNVALSNPNVGKLEVKIQSVGKYYNQPWLRLEPFATYDADTVFAKNIRLRIVKAPRDSFEVTMVKLTNGSSRDEAGQIANRINFNIRQEDTTLLLDRGIAITSAQKFRNQQVIVTIAVPVGKRIYISEGSGWGNSWGNSMNIHIGVDADNFDEWENNMDSYSLSWRHNVEYVMTQKGLERTDKLNDNNDQDDNDGNSNETIEQFRKSKEDMQREKEQKLKELQEIDKELQNANDSTRYHYQPAGQDTAPGKKVKAVVKNTAYINNTVSEPITDIMMIKYAL